MDRSEQKFWSWVGSWVVLLCSATLVALAAIASSCNVQVAEKTGKAPVPAWGEDR